MHSIVVASILAALLQQSPALHIVVVEGEGAVNIIQQKTAVRPPIEVRDRNNVPVAGATVTFAIGGGQPAAFAGGLQTLTVTTNAAGQAAAGGLNAISSGAFQIQVQAAYQGQIATAAISQTNFATAAAASQAGALSGGASGGTGGSTGAASGAAGGGGGISGTTIGIVGAAVAGGAVVATKAGVIGGDASSNEYTAQFSGPLVVTTSSPRQGTCVSNRAVTGTVEIDMGRKKGDLDVSAPAIGPRRHSPATGISDLASEEARTLLADRTSHSARKKRMQVPRSPASY